MHVRAPDAGESESRRLLEKVAGCVDDELTDLQAFVALLDRVRHRAGASRPVALLLGPLQVELM